jgi:hypothetical protein
MHLDKLAIVVPTTLQRPISVLAEVADRLGQASKMGAEICVFVNSLQSRDSWKLSVFEGLDAVAIKLASSRLPIDQSMMQAVFMSSRKYILQCGDDDIPSLDLLLRCQDYMEEKNLDLVVSCISSKAGTEDCPSRQLGGGWPSAVLPTDVFSLIFMISFPTVLLLQNLSCFVRPIAGGSSLVLATLIAGQCGLLLLRRNPPV